MIRNLKKWPKKVTFVIAIAATICCISLTKKVFATGEYTLTFTTSGNHTMAIDGGHLKIDDAVVDLKDSNNTTIGTASCNNNNTTCTITVSDGIGGSLNYNSQEKFTLYMQGHPVDVNHSFMVNEDIAVQDYEEVHNGNEPHEANFDGRAYVVWSCGTGVCYHYFSDIPNFDDGNSQYYQASTIQADNDNTKTFDVHAEHKGWVLKDTFDNWVTEYKQIKNISGEINWADVKPTDLIGGIDMREYEDQAISKGICTRDVDEEELHHCVDNYVISLNIVRPVTLQPLPDEPYDNNAYVSYGDRNFKVVIYNDEYKGISIGDLSDLNYYPASWVNPYIRTDQFDISGTSKEEPAIINTILLENTINIKKRNENGFAISKIEALDVPDGAVDINKVSGEYKITFHSNFYDRVVFKVTDGNGKSEYFMINRLTIDAEVRHDNNGASIRSNFYFDKNKSYTDYDVTAKIVYKDGTVKKVNMTAVYGIDDGLGNITPTYEFNEETDDPGHLVGKGLKRSLFEYKLGSGEENTISKVYINVENKGSTSTNYAGAFAGSDKGIELNFEEEE